MAFVPGFYPTYSMTYVGETGTPAAGFEGTNVGETRQGLYWLVPSGGPHVLTVELPVSRFPEDVAFVITSPAGRPIIGDLSINITVDPGGLGDGYGPYTLPKYTPETLRDHRIFYPELLGYGSDYILRLDITAATGSCISRVCAFDITNIDYNNTSVDSTLFDRGWTQSQVPVVKQARNNSGGLFYTAGFDTAPTRYKTLSGQMNFDASPNLTRIGRRSEVMVLPSVATYGDADNLKKLMHLQAIFGRRTNNLTRQRTGLAGKLIVPMQFKELI